MTKSAMIAPRTMWSDVLANEEEEEEEEWICFVSSSQSKKCERKRRES
jgi:hypothetical protein